MNQHALTVIELRSALEIIAARATSSLGRAAILSRAPSSDREAVRRELERVGETVAFLSARPAWGPPPVPDVYAAARRLGVEGSLLDPAELHGLGVLLTSGSKLARELRPEGEVRFPALEALRSLLHVDQKLEAAIQGAVNAEGSVLDSASRDLFKIRRRLRGAHRQIVRRLEAFVKELPGAYVVPDASVSVRDGRYVVPIRREGKGEAGGVVHGQSATGATLFVEPPVAIQLMNDLKELERAEALEVRRVLGALTDRTRPHHASLEASLDALVDFDSLQARARAALMWEGEAPQLLPSGSQAFRIVRGRHPLLLEGTEEVVPFEVDFEEGERGLVVSGPNTGGKSVFLKAVGLIAALTQAGCIPPVGPGTSIPLFTEIFADIGDEQSISASLSTFSAHLRNLAEIVRDADGGSLVLIDEMGTGTDPAEGAALARAILESLLHRGALTIVTSHLGTLKTLDEEGSGIVNASLNFDADRMEPTFHFQKGRPGRSYGLAIARRLGFPSVVLDRAESHVSEGAASVEDLLERLEQKDREAERLVESLEEQRTTTERQRAEAEELAKDLRERQRTWEKRSREESRALLLEARKEVDEAIQQVRTAQDAEELEIVARQARGRLEASARRLATKQGARGRAAPAFDLALGQRVRVLGSGTEGRVIELRDDRALIDIGGMKMEADLLHLESVDAQQGAGKGRVGSKGPAGSGWSGHGSGLASPDGAHEVDLRGFRVDEVELELERALDAAILADLPALRIIHGKGTGAVRARVQEVLKKDRRVGGFRLGQSGEGGSGVTVAEVE